MLDIHLFCVYGYYRCLRHDLLKDDRGCFDAGAYRRGRYTRLALDCALMVDPKPIKHENLKYYDSTFKYPLCDVKKQDLCPKYAD